MLNKHQEFRSLSTYGMNRKEWLLLRQGGIGGSDAPALMLPPDVFKWRRPIDVYQSKTGIVKEEQNLACEMGTYLEPFISDLFMRETGIRVRRYNKLLISNEYPYMFANIDRKIQNNNIGLEIKSTSIFNERKFSDNEFPYEYYIQIQHYMAVTGWAKWYLAALIGNKKFVWYEVERNNDDIAKIIETERIFWQSIIMPRNEKELEQWQ